MAFKRWLVYSYTGALYESSSVVESAIARVRKTSLQIDDG